MEPLAAALRTVASGHEFIRAENASINIFHEPASACVVSKGTQEQLKRTAYGTTKVVP